MSRWRRATAWLVVVAALSARPTAAQSVALAIANLKADSVSPAPTMTVTAIQARPELGPFAITLEMSTEAAFARPFYIESADGVVASFAIDSLLPEKTRIFFRTRLFDRAGNVIAEQQQQHPVQAWVQLIFPGQQSLANIDTRFPRFIWRSPAITLPPGPWRYELTVTNTRTGIVDLFAIVDDTSFADSLQANTSYRWQVRARALNSRGTGEVVVRSAGTFIITTSDQPTATVFYQNFPNPFGRGERAATTCLWFDLGEPSTVRLTIYNVRLQRVRQIVPGAIGDGRLPAGAYGRGDQTTQTGCDVRLQWDGRDDNGRVVPSGVYVVEFVANGVRTTKKMYFKAP
jgi:hypothetical protein